MKCSSSIDAKVSVLADCRVADQYPLISRCKLPKICCFEAYGNYVKVWQGEQMTLATTTLKMLLSQLPQGKFVQVHKSFVVSAAQIISRNSQNLRLSNRMIVKIGDAFKKQAKVLLFGHSIGKSAVSLDSRLCRNAGIVTAPSLNSPDSTPKPNPPVQLDMPATRTRAV
jgi:hypothetical protein